MKVIIAGSRDINQYEVVSRAITDSKLDITEVVCGCARGVDTLGRLWALRHKKPVKEFPAHWNRDGKSAGVIRNLMMAKYADALVCVHNDSHGSRHMLRAMRELEKPIFEVRLVRCR